MLERLRRGSDVVNGDAASDRSESAGRYGPPSAPNTGPHVTVHAQVLLHVAVTCCEIEP